MAAPVFMDADEIAPRKRRRSPEHTLQSWCDRFLDRVLIPPAFTTGIDHASQSTDNARARMAARGIRFGLPDVFVCQAPKRTLWIELKRGTKLSTTQEGVHRALWNAGQDVWTCSSMPEVLLALRSAGFRLHPNADELAREYEMRVEAKEKAPATPRKAWKPRVAKPSVRDVTRFERARGRTL